jgi:hypothetical protein
MKILVALILAIFAVIPAEAGPQPGRGQHTPGFRPHLGGNHFVARSDDGFHRHFRSGREGVVILDPIYNGGYDDLSGGDPVYQGQVVPQDAESLPYATPTTDPDIVVSPYEPHAAISVAGIPHGAKVQDPTSGMVFLNP